MESPDSERLNSYLAHSGVASRRGADALIAAGRVTVNGLVVTELGSKVRPGSDVIRLDGETVRPRQGRVVVVLNKPAFVVTTVADPMGRRTVMDYVDVPERVYPVGRLDFASEGLVLLTNDGQLALRLTHPRYGVEREYRVRVSGTPTEAALRAWREGVYLDDGRTAPAEVTLESSTGGSTWLRFVLREGRNREIRRMVEALKYRVHRLVRVRMGPVVLGGLPPGHWRRLTAAETAQLLAGDAASPGGQAKASAATPGAATSSDASARPARRYKAGWARPKPRASYRGGHRRARG
jgi:23S rRNA pseudouridine2605 synthase